MTAEIDVFSARPFYFLLKKGFTIAKLFIAIVVIDVSSSFTKRPSGGTG